MSLRSLLNTTATIQRAMDTNTALGTTKTYASHLTGVLCRISAVPARELGTIGDASRALAAEYKMWTTPGQDIKPSDRVVAGGRTYEILDVDRDVAAASHHMRLGLLEVR